jgi:hypothetical protein
MEDLASPELGIAQHQLVSLSSFFLSAELLRVLKFCMGFRGLGSKQSWKKKRDLTER